MTGALASISPLSRPLLTVADMPSEVTGYGNSGALANITTGIVEAEPAGGASPYTYAWAQISASGYTWLINSASSRTTTFTCNGLGPGNTAEATFTVTVTDARGSKATSSVTAYANNGQPYDPVIRSHLSQGGEIP